MDRKKELKQAFIETPIKAGIFQIKNTKNGKILIESTRNLKVLNRVKFMLENNGYTNMELQKDWDQFGKEAFEFEVVEILKKPEEGFFNEKKELEKLKEKWLEHLQPYDERGYHQKRF